MATASEGSSRLSCLPCKRKKLKCDRHMPQCVRCARADEDCVYPSSRQTATGKRKQLRDLEARIDQLQNQFNSFTAKFHADAEADIDTDIDIDTGSPSTTTQRLAPASEFGGHSSQSSSVANTVDCATFVPELSNIIEQLPDSDPNLQEELTDIYFDKLYHEAPMIHRDSFMASLHLDRSRQPPRCLQLMIMASAASVTHAYASLAMPMYRHARALAEEDEMRDQDFVTVAHAQCWILITYFESQQSMLMRGSTSLSKSIRIMQLLNLHRLDQSDPSTCDAFMPLVKPPQDWTEFEERRRTWWVGFSADCLVAATTGLPLLNNVKHPSNFLPAPEDNFSSGREVVTTTLDDALKDPATRPSIFGLRVILSHLFCQSVEARSAPCPWDGVNGTIADSYWSRHVEIDNSLGVVSSLLPELSPPYRCQHSVFVNILFHVATICLHNAVIRKARNDGCPVPEEIVRQSLDQVFAASDKIIQLLSVWQGLKIALRNPILVFLVYTTALVFIERSVQEENLDCRNKALFLFNLLNSVVETHPVAKMQAARLAADLEKGGIDPSAQTELGVS